MTTEWVLEEALPRILNALDAFRPDLLILSSGFDAHKRDPVDLGRLDAADYGVLTRRLVDWAERKCCGRLVSVLEGGYGVDCGPGGEYVTSGRKEAFDTCLRAHVDELAGAFVEADVDEEADLRQEADAIRAADAAAAAARNGPMRGAGRPLVLLAGNPNVGKTTVFNRLAGVRARTGNYPGVTVERRTAPIHLGDGRAELVDLPGTYSLSAHSPEEQIAADEEPDVEIENCG